MSSPPESPPRRVDGSMSLLVDLMTNTLDEGYAERARRRPPAGAAPGQRMPVRAVGLVVLVVLGVMTGTAVAHVRDRAAAAQGLRSGLAAQVQERSEETERMTTRAAQLRRELAAARERALEADVAGTRIAETIRALEVATGTVEVTGPGVVLTLDDAPAEEDPSAPRGGAIDEGRVLDRDLQEMVNGLWAAGAEAVAVNGVRVSSRSAIRSAGEAILVDFRPLSPPYRVEAVGRPADLEVDLLAGPAGRYLEALTTVSGITAKLSRADELSLPAAPEPALRAAEVPRESR